jgi:glucose/arabinose dehydrogenase
MIFFRKEAPQTDRAWHAKRPLLFLAVAIAFALAGGLTLPATAKGHHHHEDSKCHGPVAGRGYSYSVVASDLPSVDNLARTADGTLYATLERKKGRGEVMKILGNGKSEVVLRGLRRPDGLRADHGRLFIAEESKDGPLIEYDIKTKTLHVITHLGYLEGLTVLPGDEFLVTRDRKKGSLIRVSESGETAVLIRGLRRPEGIAQGKKGEVFIAETATGKVLLFRDGKLTTLVSGLEKPDQLAGTSDGTRLITEDADPGRLLSYKDGRLSVVASCLASPQGILPLEGNDGVLVSEQGRDRVLKFTVR